MLSVNNRTSNEWDELFSSEALRVAFQPIVDIREGVVFGYEVLGRCAPISGRLSIAAKSPATLIEAARREGRLLELDRTWRKIALRQIASHSEKHVLYFINVDPRVVEETGYTPGFTLALIRQYDLPPSRFVLELTEIPSQDPIAVERTLSHYARQGFKVALDDLGAGQQSLATLLRVSPDIVKLDRELIRDISHDRHKVQLLESLAEFGRRSGTLLVAEGIEEESELNCVLKAGVPLGQGYLLGRPEPLPKEISPSVRAILYRSQRSSHRISSRTIAAADPSLTLASLVEGLRIAPNLEAMLPLITRTVTSMLGVERASLRLLDESRQQLLVAARTGEALHDRGGANFTVGEGLAGWIAHHASSLRLGDTHSDPRFVAKPGANASFSSFLGVPLLDSEGVIGVLATTSPATDAFSGADERWLKVIAGIASPYLVVARLARLAETDPLTTVLNRRALTRLLPDDTARRIEPTSVVAIDIDHFKTINDRFGHQAGDIALREVAQLLAASIRQHDQVVRTGGEEFVLVLPGATLREAEIVAERARKKVSGAMIIPGTLITISAGIAQRSVEETAERALSRADRALYLAKTNGRNRVESARK